MGETTGISWTDHTFNPWLGCERVSPGCDHCYAERGSKRFAAQHGLKLWEGDRHITSQSYWKQPDAWNRAAEKLGKPARVFCGSWCDIGEMGRPALDMARVGLWDLVEETPWLIWQLLTKRPQNLRYVLPGRWLKDGCPKNVWLGVTAEDQQRWDERVPILASLPCRIHFVSAEPLLGRIDIYKTNRPEWLIVGGESGPNARPFRASWADKLIAQSLITGVVPFIKQMGTLWAKAHGAKHPHGADPKEWPTYLRVQEFPA